jgi:hypothetical protein
MRGQGPCSSSVTLNSGERITGVSSSDAAQADMQMLLLFHQLLTLLKCTSGECITGVSGPVIEL